MPTPLSDLEVLAEFSFLHDPTPTEEEVETCERILRKLGEPIPEDLASSLRMICHTATRRRVVTLPHQGREVLIKGLRTQLAAITAGFGTEGNA